MQIGMVAVIQLEMTIEELLALPVSVDLVTAGRAFGLGRTKAFELAQADDFPCRVLRVGKKYRVPRSAIFEALAIDPAEARAHLGNVGTASGQPANPVVHRTSRHRGSTRPTGDSADGPSAA